MSSGTKYIGPCNWNIKNIGSCFCDVFMVCGYIIYIKINLLILNTPNYHSNTMYKTLIVLFIHKPTSYFNNDLLIIFKVLY